MNFFRKNKTGLALGGGAVLGAAHVGVLKYLSEKQIKIDAITGTSIGAFVASLYAFGKSPDEIEDIARELKWMDISRLSLSQHGLLSNKKLGETLQDVLGDVNIEDAEIPLAMIATNIASGEKVILEKGPLATAVMASTCIPGVFIPVETDGQMLVDGGVIENVPISALDGKAGKIIAVDLVYNRSFRKPDNIIEVIMNTFDFTMRNATRQYLDKADILITPDLSEFNPVDPKHTPELILKGYEAAVAEFAKPGHSL